VSEAQSEMKPERIQLRRSKGWRLQEVSRALNGLPAVNVARPSKWGNPYRIKRTAAACVAKFRQWIANNPWNYPFHGEIRRELRGKNLACYCELDAACHADVLLEIANAP
jgi:hypothetical protein